MRVAGGDVAIQLGLSELANVGLLRIDGLHLQRRTRCGGLRSVLGLGDVRAPRIQSGQPLGSGHIDALLDQGTIAARLLQGLGQRQVRIAAQDLLPGGADKAKAQHPGSLSEGGTARAGHEDQAVGRAGAQPHAQSSIGNQFGAV